MEVVIYDKPVQWQALRRIGKTLKAVGEYERSFYEYGRFTLSIHALAPFAGELTTGRIVRIDGNYWGVIRNRKIQRGMTNLITVTGYQLKGALWQRITVPLDMPPENAPAGYDSKAGSTEALIKYFASRNIAGAKRLFENMGIEPDGGRGSPDDKYYTRFETLGDAVAKLAKRARLGWDIVGDEKTGAFTLKAIAGVDRTARQGERAPAVFDLALGTLLGFEYSEETEQSANVFYCTRSGAEFADEALTQTYFLDSAEAVGLDRFERHLNISISDDSALFEEMEETARKEMENYRPVATISCTAARKLIPGVDYDLGDYATFVSREDGIVADRQITAIRTAATEQTVTDVITLGETRLNSLDYIRRDMKNR